MLARNRDGIDGERYWIHLGTGWYLVVAVIPNFPDDLLQIISPDCVLVRDKSQNGPSGVGVEW